jgi:HNH endonuclease
VNTNRIPINKRLRFRVFARDNFTCQYCGMGSPDVALEVDHIHPVARGGRHHLENFTTSCHDCNIGKGTMLIEEQIRLQKFNRISDEEWSILCDHYVGYEISGTVWRCLPPWESESPEWFSEPPLPSLHIDPDYHDTAVDIPGGRLSCISTEECLLAAECFTQQSLAD